MDPESIALDRYNGNDFNSVINCRIFMNTIQTMQNIHQIHFIPQNINNEVTL